MAIPASHIASVQPRVMSGGGADLEMNGLLLSKSSLIPTSSPVLEFTSARSVGDYFGTDSVEYRAASVYFAGYQNKSSAPRAFLIGRRIDQEVHAWLRSAPFTKSLASLQAITDGGLTIKTGGSQILTQINLSGATSLSMIASRIQAKLISGVTCTYSSLNKCFTFQTKGSVIEYAQSPASGTDLAVLLGLTEETGAVLSPGSSALDTESQMAALRKHSENWVSFTTAWEADADEMETWAAWANDHHGWLYVPWTTQAATTRLTSPSDPASRLKASGYDHTAIVYGSLEYSMFIMGAIASVAWLRANGAITFAFKRQNGLAAWVNDESSASVLEKRNCNYFGNFSTRNQDFVFLYPGCLSASDYGFIDPYINSVWLNNRIQAALQGLSRSGRVPYTDRGFTMIRSWLMDPVNAAINNAVIEPGISLSEAQRSELMNEAGLDIASELETQGYYIQIKDPGAPVRARRESPVVSLWYTYGGSVQKIEIASPAVL